MPYQRASSSSRYIKQISTQRKSKTKNTRLRSKTLGQKQITEAKLTAADQIQAKQSCVSDLITVLPILTASTISYSSG